MGQPLPEGLMPRRCFRPVWSLVSAMVALAVSRTPAAAQGTRLLRQPTVSATSIAFEYGGDLWVVGREGGDARRLTSTPAVESDPYLSPDGQWLAFTSNRSGAPSVYVMPVAGGDPQRLTWNPAPAFARGWSPDGKAVLVASSRNTAPVSYNRLWTVPLAGGPATLLPEPMAMRGAFSPDGKRIVVDRVSRWDVEFRNYRGGQNTPLTILDLTSLAEVRLPNERTTDVYPVWIGDTIYFLSDRDYASNVWAYDTRTGALQQVTHETDADLKTLSGGAGLLVFEQDGYIHTLDPATGQSRRLEITVHADFPWAMPRWADVARSIASASLSATGKRALFEARGEIFTVPVEKGDARNLTRSPGAADRAPVWSPDGEQVAWFSDSGSGYRLLIADQAGLLPRREIALGESKLGWAPAWSPDGKRIAFVDDRARLKVLDVATGRITTADTDGVYDHAGLAPSWSPDSRWLAYAKEFPNHFRRIVVWSADEGRAHVLTDALAGAVDPVWDRNGKYLYFLASTDLGLTSAWANVSSLTRRSTYGVYIALLRSSEPSPLLPESDEEPARGAPPKPSPPADTGRGGGAAPAAVPVQIDFDRLDRRIVPLPLPVRDYTTLLPGAAGVLMVAERVPNEPGLTLRRFDLAKRKAEVFVSGVSLPAASADGKKLLYRQGEQWFVVGTDAPPKGGDGRLTVTLQAPLDPAREWGQISRRPGESNATTSTHPICTAPIGTRSTPVTPRSCRSSGTVRT